MTTEHPPTNPPESHIPLEPIESSSQLEAYGYDPETETLAVRFKGKPATDTVPARPGTLYHYANFTATEWAAFRDAESKGSHFIRNIKPYADRYPYTRIEEKWEAPWQEPKTHDQETPPE